MSNINGLRDGLRSPGLRSQTGLVTENRREQAGKGRWRKGQSGNPGGRPADYGQFRELCRGKSPQAVAALEAALSAGDSSSVAAARVLLEYGYGRPASAPEDLAAAAAGPSPLVALSRAELLAIARGEPVGE